MVAIASNTSETSTWDILNGFPKLHSRAREAKTNRYAEATGWKPLTRVEIKQVIYDSRIRLESFSRDPIGYEGSEWNLYEYVAGKPTKYLDPSGLRLFSCCNGKTYEPAGQGCCNKAIYSLATDCCENGVVVAKVEIQTCRRRLNGDDSSIPFFGWLSHTFIVCPDGKMFGKHPKPFEDPGSTGKASGYVNEEDNDLSKAVCNPKKICPSEAKRMCKAGPTNVPYDLLCIPGYGTNCHSWGNSNSW